MITPELRKSAGDVYATAERLRRDAAATVAPILARVEAIIEEVETLVGKPIVGRCVGCDTIIVEGDTYTVDDSTGLLICGQLQGSAAGATRCIDIAEMIDIEVGQAPEVAHG